MKKLSLTLSIAFTVALFTAGCNPVKGQTTSFELKKDSLFAHKRQVKQSFFNRVGIGFVNFLFKSSDPLTRERADAVYDEIAPNYSALMIQKIIDDLNKKIKQDVVVNINYWQLVADYGGGIHIK